MTRWRPAAAWRLALVFGCVVLIAGVAAGRAELALFGVPLILGAVVGRSSKPSGATGFAFIRTTPTPDAAKDSVRETLQITPVGTASAVQVRVASLGHLPTVMVVGADTAREIDLSINSVRTGPSDSFTIQARGFGPLGATVEDCQTLTGPTRLVLPQATRLQRVPLPTRLRGLTGPRLSRRLGDGLELRDLHPMGPGDRLRRVDWRATARMSPELDQLYVRRTYSTAEAGAMLVVDSRDEVAGDLTTWRGSEPIRLDQPTSLDLARQAAASIATALISSGSRVGFEDLATNRRPLTPATGQRHLRRLLYALALSTPFGSSNAFRLRPPQLPNDVIVYLFTTLLDDTPVQLTRSWRDAGMPVVVIDTLPGVAAVKEFNLRLAWRIVKMERDDRKRELELLGVPVLRWARSERQAAITRLEAMSQAADRGHRLVGIPR